jgi:hypothetical protein
MLLNENGKATPGKYVSCPKKRQVFPYHLGKIVYDAHPNIGKALSYYWKHKAMT